jgi:hypothetical protein
MNWWMNLFAMSAQQTTRLLVAVPAGFRAVIVCQEYDAACHEIQDCHRKPQLQ